MADHVCVFEPEPKSGIRLCIDPACRRLERKSDRQAASGHDKLAGYAGVKDAEVNNSLPTQGGGAGDRETVAEIITGFPKSYYDRETTSPALREDWTEALRLADKILSALQAAPSEGGEPVAWVEVEGFEGLYAVSSAGDVKSLRTGKVLSKPLAGSGYQKADLWKDGVRTQTTVHRLVARAFVACPDGCDEVNHIDGNKLNNAASNLEWSTRQENTDHSRYVLGNDIKPVVATDAATGAEEYYPSIAEAARNGYSQIGIYKALNGQRKTHGGKTWAQAEWRGPARPPAPSEEPLVGEPTEAMVEAAVENLIEQYDQNADWDDAKDVIEKLDTKSLYRAMLAAAPAPDAIRGGEG